MVLRDPLLLVTTSSGSGNSANWCAGSGDLALLRLGNEGEVGVVADTTEETESDEICDPPGRELVRGLRTDTLATPDIHLDVEERTLWLDDGNDGIVRLNTVFLALGFVRYQ